MIITSSPKVAVVSDWLVNNGGDIRVLEQILQCFPDADLYVTIDFLPEKHRSFLKNKKINVSFIQKLPYVKNLYWYYTPLMPIAIEQFDLSKYDIIISSHNAVAKGVLVGPDQLHVSYVHSPMRFAWDLQGYYLNHFRYKEGVKSLVARILFHYLRIWDCRTTNGVDVLIANSHFIGRRITKIYRRDSSIIYPSINNDIFTLREEKEDFYLTAGFMNPYKRIDLVVQSFTEMSHQKLMVIGNGPAFYDIKLNAGKNIKFLGYQPLEVLKDYMQRAKAFVYAAPEDFGIIIGEAQSCGTPVITYGKGGACEIIKDLDQEKPTGILYKEQTKESLIEAVMLFEREKNRILPQNCRENIYRFSPKIFQENFKKIVEKKWIEFKLTEK